MPDTTPRRPAAPAARRAAWDFFIGLIMAAAGGYLLLNQVQVTTSFWRFGAYGGFGLTPAPAAGRRGVPLLQRQVGHRLAADTVGAPSSWPAC